MTEKPDPFDVAALERSLNDSATRVSTIWVSYLIFALYLLVATGTATPRQLFLEEPVKMPQLQGANLASAQLPGADLGSAELQGAFLRSARLQGANLDDAHLQGAYLSSAQLQGADLRFAQLQGADLRDAQVQGADLGNAHRQGANLRNAHLQGAKLGSAELQGADLEGSELTLAFLAGAYLWRAGHANCSDALIITPKFEAILERDAPGTVSPTSESIDHFIESVVANVRNALEDVVRGRLREGLIVPMQKDDLAAMETNWRNCAANSQKVVESEYLQQHAGFLRDLVCNAATDRKEIAAGITENWISNDKDRRDYSSRLARGLLGRDGKECAATKDLSDRTKSRLSQFASSPLPAN